MVTWRTAYSKRSVTVWTKVLEVLTMCFVTFALWQNRLDLAAVALFLVCTQGAIFGPSKYGLLPELLADQQIELGQRRHRIVDAYWQRSAERWRADFWRTSFTGRQEWSGIFLVALSLLGLLSSFGISKVPAADPQTKVRLELGQRIFRGESSGFARTRFCGWRSLPTPFSGFWVRSCC